MYSHMQAHFFENDEKLCEYMKPNREFQQENKLPLATNYAVSPHHAGVYPVHEVTSKKKFISNFLVAFISLLARCMECNNYLH